MKVPLLRVARNDESDNGYVLPQNCVPSKEIAEDYALNHNIWHTVYLENLIFQTYMEFIVILVTEYEVNHLTWDYM